MASIFSQLCTALIFSGALVACSAKNASIVSPDYASAEIDLSTPRATAHSMMIAMYRGDVDMIDTVFTEDGTLRRVRPNGTVTDNGLARWRDWVGTLEVGQAHEEIFNLKVEQFENLATVWAPFVITVNGEIAGCGVNHLAMIREGQAWRVAAGMDTQAPKDSCSEFKTKTLSSE